MKANFINTSDKETAEKLRELGFQELPKQGKFWVFVNNVDIDEFDDVQFVNYTNVLTF